MDFHFVIIENNEGDYKTIEANCNIACKELGLNGNYLRYKNYDEYKSSIDKIDVIDLLIADLRLNDPLKDLDGWRTIHHVLEREFVPVVIYSGIYDGKIPEEYKDLFLLILKKGQPDTNYLKNNIIKIIKIRQEFLQSKNRILMEFNKISLKTVSKMINKEDFLEQDEKIVASMAISRLNSYLLNVPINNCAFYPESIFLYPSLEIQFYPKEVIYLGDIIEDTFNKNIWLTIVPFCDLIFYPENKVFNLKERKEKVDNVILLPCYLDWKQIDVLKNMNNKQNRRDYIKNKIEKDKSHIILKCPKEIFGKEYMMISFKNYNAVNYNSMKKSLKEHHWIKLTTIATPYIESIQHQFIHDFSRIGTPDTETASNSQLKWIDGFIDSD